MHSSAPNRRHSGFRRMQLEYAGVWSKLEYLWLESYKYAKNDVQVHRISTSHAHSYYLWARNRERVARKVSLCD